MEAEYKSLLKDLQAHLPVNPVKRCIDLSAEAGLEILQPEEESNDYDHKAQDNGIDFERNE